MFRRSLALLAVTSCSLTLQAEDPPSAQIILQRAKAATVIVLAGEGAGRLHSVGTGVVISREGVILTALHVIHNASEVQIRLPNGETFDHVQLIGSDDRRDVAALRITAGELSTLPLGSTTSATAGDPVLAVTNANGLSWSATEGIVSALRPADEVPGAGSGFRLLEFTAPIARGSSGGALVDKSGNLLGIITRGNGTSGFAVPIESVAGLPASGQQVTLGSGTLLRLPTPPDASPSSSVAVAHTDPQQVFRNAKTITLQSKTAFLTVDTLDRALRKQKDWDKLGLTIVQDARVADVLIQIDRPLFTYVHTFVIVDKKTSVVLGSGKVTAFDGTIASGGLAKDIVQLFEAGRTPANQPKNGALQ